jgi:hypothetical protein
MVPKLRYVLTTYLLRGYTAFRKSLLDSSVTLEIGSAIVTT